MPKCLDTIAVVVPTIGMEAPLSDVASLFLAQDDRQLLVVTDFDGKPQGAIARACALEQALRGGVGLNAASIMRRDIPHFNSSTPIRAAVALAGAQGMPIFEIGLLVTRNGRFLGFVPAEALCRWMEEERQRLRDERDQARRAWSKAMEQRFRFVANMGHELRTPLNAMLGYAEMIRDGIDHGEKTDAYRDYAATMHEAGAHLLNIVNTVLDMAKVDAKLMPLREERVDIRAIVDASATMLAAAMERKQLRIFTRVNPQLPKILADPQIMRQILLNLLSNAIKFSKAGGKIVVSADLDRRGALRLAVKDEGPGIAPADIEKVMQPFRQAEQGQFGTGLGLPLVKAFAELHDGGFQILSAQGKGTKAVVTLPAARVFGASPAGQGEFIFSRPSLRA